jgi:16S rRNA (cytidine1402-2'-O)-methyltransferase
MARYSMAIAQRRTDGEATVSNAAGVLYVVATPIGNLEDVTHRALRVLSEARLIAAEDTRRTRQLLAHYGISGKLAAFHDHNEADVTPRLLARLEAGDDIALVSDAGTPLISDPGFVLVRAARGRGLRVVPIPGPNAAVAALSASGLPSDRFLFVGFPPRSGPKRRAWLDELRAERGTLVLYEAGNRVVATLRDLAFVLGQGRHAVLARELTKRFETFLCGSLEQLREGVERDALQEQGELVLLVEGERALPGAADRAEAERVLRILTAELPLRQAAGLAAAITGARKNDLYGLALEWQGQGGRPSGA